VGRICSIEQLTISWTNPPSPMGHFVDSSFFGSCMDDDFCGIASSKTVEECGALGGPMTGLAGVGGPPRRRGSELIK
jgi:hypothetical protein